ncbi:MAG: ogr/Delta-like zinc finger family protein [Pseudomonadota bacterium]
MTPPCQNPRPATRRRPCPDCGAALIKRSSKSLHPLMTTTFLVCQNLVCGATFSGTDEITHRMSPSSRPNPEINLPDAPSVTRRKALAMAGMSTAAEAQADDTGAST